MKIKLINRLAKAFAGRSASNDTKTAQIGANRKGAHIPPVAGSGCLVALFNEDDSDFFDVLQPFNYEEYLKREGLA